MTNDNIKSMFHNVPLDTVIKIGNKRYIQKEGMYAVAHAQRQKTPFRIECTFVKEDVTDPKKGANIVAVKCVARLFLTEPNTLKQACAGLLAMPDVDSNVKDWAMEQIGKPDAEEETTGFLTPNMSLDEYKFFYKKLRTNAKMRVISEFCGAGYGIPDDYVSGDTEAMSQERLTREIEAQLTEFEGQDAKQDEVAEPVEMGKTEYITMINALCQRSLPLKTRKAELMAAMLDEKGEPIVRNSQLSLDQCKELLDALQKESA